MPIERSSPANDVTASAAVTNTTDPTVFDKKYTIPANNLKAGDVLRIQGQGIATATNSTDTLKIEVMVGATEVAEIPALDVADNDTFFFDILVQIRTVGASGTCVAAGIGVNGASGTATVKHLHKASQAIDTTAALEVGAKATWSVASAGNSCRLDLLNVEILRAAA